MSHEVKSIYVRPDDPDQVLKDPARLAALASTGLRDGGFEPSFDRLVRLAAKLFSAPVAFVSLIDDERQYFKSRVGPAESRGRLRETPLSSFFCRHLVAGRQPLAIDDVRLDPRVMDNPSAGDPGVIAFLGIPLIVDDHVIGSFCVIDGKPRSWSSDDVGVLGDLAESVVTEIRLRAERDRLTRQRAEEEDARQKLQVTLSSIGDAVIAADDRGLVTFMNPAAERLCGWTREDALGKPLDAVFRVVNGHARSPVENLFKTALEGAERLKLPEDTFLIAKDGSERPIEDSMAPIKDGRGEVKGAVVVFRDAAEKKTAARRLADYEGRFSLIFESVKDFSIFTVDLDGVITSWNVGAENVFGHSEGEAIGQPFAMIFTPEDRMKGVPALELKSASVTKRASDERWHLRKDGSRFFASGIVTDLTDLGGRLIGFTKVARDITATKLAEERLKSQAEALKENDRRKDEFLAMLAHELRNPLGVIGNGVQLVQRVKEPELLFQLSETILHQVRHLTRLIDDLLDVSRITQGKIVLKKETVELAEVIERAVELVRPIVEEKSHHMTFSVPDRTVQFVADPTRAEQILGNLLTNAAKYSNPGGSIHVSAVVDDDVIVLRVRDTGIGIPADMLPRVFGLFTQVDGSIDRSRGGLGIGLTLVQTLVEMHGGSVSAESEGEGKGSEFTVRLPVGHPDPEVKKPDRPSVASPVGTGRILIVDDNVETVRLVARMLKHHGYQVESAHDGHGAFDAARRFHPDVILLDIGLPGMNGYEVANVLRKEPCCETTRFIAVSGYGEEKSLNRSKEAGFDHHLIKPLDFEKLLQILDRE